MVRKSLLRFGFVVILLTCFAPLAQAGFLSGFTGNSGTVVQKGTVFNGSNANGSSDGLINFAVYENTSSDWESALGVEAITMPLNVLGGQGVGSNQPGAKYIYFYQLVNINPFSPEDRLTEIQIERGLFTEGGYITVGGMKAVFNEAAGAVGPSTNPAIGTTTFDSVPGNHVPGVSGLSLAATPFVGNSGAALPTSHNLLSEFYEFEFANPDVAPSLGYTVVLYMTSDRAPTYLLGRTHNGTITDGDVPSNVPELGTFAMSFGALAMGLVVAFGTSPRKRDE